MKLTDTQLIVLNNAAQRSTMLALPLPANLKGGAAHQVVKPLIEKGLLEEIDANVRAGDTVWRETGSGHGVTLVITEAGLAAIGIEPEKPKSKGAPKVVASKAPAKASKAATGARKTKATMTAAPAGKSAPKASAGETLRTPREGTKQAIMIAMLQRKNGATIAEIVAETGWQPHTVRGAFAGALKKKLGLNIVSEKVERRGRCIGLPNRQDQKNLAGGPHP
ncbi:MAG: DUF3489 domain-containing protein [Methylocystis sp.]